MNIQLFLILNVCLSVCSSLGCKSSSNKANYEIDINIMFNLKNNPCSIVTLIIALIT